MKSEGFYPFKYLVRRLTMRYDEGREEILPLMLVEGRRESDWIDQLVVSPFEREVSGTIYLSSMILELHEGRWKIIHQSL